MSKKNLARTAIEGGRSGRNKWERRNSHTVERTSERDFCRKAEVSPDIFDDDVFITKKEKVHKDFDDKLGPMYRWLHSQVGKPWDTVHSEVSKKFDDRTTAGRHILHDHLLSSVEEVPDLTYRRWYRNTGDYTTSRYENDFYVDADGLLQAKTYIPHGHTRVPKFNTASIANWLNGRAVGKIGNKLFWFVPVTGNAKRGTYDHHEWKTEWNNRNYSYYNLLFLYSYQEPIYVKNKEGVLEKIGHKTVWRDSTPNFRQDRKLNEKEMVFWNSMPEWYQNKILERSPTYPDNLKPRHITPYYYY